MRCCCHFHGAEATLESMLDGPNREIMHRLLIHRLPGEALLIDGPARVTWDIDPQNPGRVRLVIDAPLTTHVLREEIADRGPHSQ